MPLPPAYSTGTGTGIGALEFDTRTDNGKPAIFTSTGNRDLYYTAHPEEKQALAYNNKAVGIGTLDTSGNVTSVSAAYIWKNDAWTPIATNFVGRPGPTGTPGSSTASVQFVGDDMVFTLSDGSTRTIPGAKTFLTGPKGEPGTGGMNIDPDVKPGDILSISQDKSKLVRTEATVLENGSLKAGNPNSLYLENAHKISSGVRNVFTINQSDGKVYSPCWIETAIDQDTIPVARMYTDRTASVLEVGNPADTQFTNPDFSMEATENRRLWSMHVHMANNMTNVVFEIYHNDVRMWAVNVGSTTANAFKIVDFVNLTSPVDFIKGQTYRFKMSSKDGDVITEGNQATGRTHMLMDQRLWSDRSLSLTDKEFSYMEANADKTATVYFNDKTNVTFDAKIWFEGGGPAPNPQEVYYGWYDQSRDLPPTETEIKAGKKITTTSVFTSRYRLNRIDAGGLLSARVFVAWPASEGEAQGISLGFFTEEWLKGVVSVDGVNYNVLYSDTNLIPTDINIQIVKN